MRCNNCGWENPDQNSKCEKCNTPLQNDLSRQAAQPVRNLNKTVAESAAFPETKDKDAHLCAECGYPLREGARVCPNCGYGVTTNEHQSSAPHKQPAQVHQQANAMKGTVNPWIQMTPQAKCTLTLVKHDNETETPAPQQYKGEMHELNRANLDKENMTITSKVQAVLTYENGQWYIEDRSAQHTTFLYVGHKTPIKGGDIILMGNRQFVFSEEK